MLTFPSSNPFVNIVLFIIITVVVLLVIAFIFRYINQRIVYFKHTVNLILDRFAIILVVLSAAYVLYYRSSFVNGSLSSDFYFQPEVADALEKLSYFAFSFGTFSAVLKYINSMLLFKKEFKKVILSEEFDQLLTDKLDVLAYSDEHLIRQGNIEDIWQRMTLVKYQKQFPKLYGQLKEKLAFHPNHLFSKNNITFYLKNFKVKYIFKLIDDDYVQIEIVAYYTIVRPTKDLFEYDFGIQTLKEDYDKHGLELDMVVQDDEGDKLIENGKDESEYGEDIKIKMDYSLSGSKEYHVYRKFIMAQNMKKSREFSFGSNRIIDFLEIQVKYDDDLNVIFSKVNENMFAHDNLETKNEKSYTHRGVILPGEKFKLFILKNN